MFVSVRPDMGLAAGQAARQRHRRMSPPTADQQAAMQVLAAVVGARALPRRHLADQAAPAFW